MLKEQLPPPFTHNTLFPVPEELVLLSAWDWVVETADHYTACAKTAGNSPAVEWICEKIIHTNEVVQAMTDIFPPEGINGLSLTEALLAAIVHDVARFPQLFLQGNFCDTEFDHGSESSKMLLDRSPFSNAIQTGRIAWAVHTHNKLETRTAGDDPLVLCLRDADKLAILRRMDVFVKEIFGEKSCVEEIHVKDDTDRYIS